MVKKITEIAQFQQNLAACTNNDRRFCVLLDALAQYHIRLVKYGFGSASEITRKSGRPVFLTNFSDEWEELAKRENMRSPDLVLIHCVRHTTPIWFSELREALFGDNPSRDRLARYQAAIDAGMGNGFCVPLNAQKPVFAAGVVMIGDPKLENAEFEARLRPCLLPITEILRTFHSAVDHRELYLGELNLTQREQETLRLTALGMRVSQIAYELSISARTVEKFIASARKKLRCETLAESVAKAQALGLLEVAEP